MSETHADHGHGHAGPGLQAYLVIFGALSIFTLVSFVVNEMVRHESMAPMVGFAVILGVAVVKATLVGAYFMHLVLDWRMVYFMLIPAFILATMMIIVFLPDFVLAWHTAEELPERQSPKTELHREWRAPASLWAHSGPPMATNDQ